MKRKLAVVAGLAVVVCAVFAGSFIKGNAEKTQFSIQVPDQKVVKGEEFTMEINVTGSAPFWAVDAYLSYDAEKTEFIPEENEHIMGTGGVLHIVDSFEEGKNSMSYSLKMKALETGKAEFSITDATVELSENYEVKELSSSKAVVEIGINSTDSKDAKLAELEVFPGELTPAFAPAVTDYQIQVDKSTDELILSAVASDSDSVVTVEGNEKLATGNNTVKIQVTSPSGVSKIYTILVKKSA